MCSLLKWHLVEETKWEKNLEKVEVEAEAWLSDQKLKPMKLEELGQFSQEKEHNWREQIVINEAGWARYLQGPLKPSSHCWGMGEEDKQLGTHVLGRAMAKGCGELNFIEQTKSVIEQAMVLWFQVSQ